MLTRIVRRRARSFAAAPVILAAIACSDAVGPADEPSVQIASARLTSGNMLPATIASGGTARFTFDAGTTRIPITAEWLDASGRPIPDGAAANLELRITGATFLPSTGTFSGWITELEEGSTLLQVVAWHTTKASVEFESRLEVVVLEPYECDNAIDPWCY